MNKESQIKKRTWKYFREQKAKEIKYHFKKYWSRWCAISIFFSLFSQAFWAPFKVGNTEPTCPTIAIIGLCILGFWVLLLFIYLIICFIDWLSSNWKKAKKRAEKDFK